MTGPRGPVTELDLHAYADGLLDGDPARKAEVEAYLQAHPEASQRVADYARQNEAIRRAYGASLNEPVPERLYTALGAGRRRPRRWIGTAAALGAVALFAGAGGWLLGSAQGPEGRQIQAFVERVSVGHLTSPARHQGEVRVARREAARPLQWLTEQNLVRTRLPDLSAHGYAVADKRIVTIDGQRLVQVIYSGPGERRVSLFLQPRWQSGPDRMRILQSNEVNVAYWVEGPLAYGLASSADGRELQELAVRVREAMRSRPAQLQPVPGRGLDAHAGGGTRVAGEQAAIAPPDQPQTRSPPRQSGL